MSVRFDLTAIAFELTDSVIYMDGSPAYDAFKEEIEAILADMQSKGQLSSAWTVDEKDLTAKSEETLKNMHRAFLIWSYSEELKNGRNDENSVGTYVKLFFKSQLELLQSLNGGELTVAPEDVKGLIEKYKNTLLTDSAAYDSVKKFFKGYIYGYFFNYLTEQDIMKKYAEMLAYLGVMSNKITTTISEQQKILPKMAPLLTNDRFKYINGFVPTELMLNIVYDRIEFGTISENEASVVKNLIKSHILSTYKTEKEDDIDLVSDDVTVSLMSEIFGSYVNVPAFSSGIYNKCFSGIRTFLDADRDDTGAYDANAVSKIISDKCKAGYIEYYGAKAPNIDTTVGGNEAGYKYPVICADENDYFYSKLYEEFIYPVIDTGVYEVISAGGYTSGVFPFIDEAMKINAVKTVYGAPAGAVTVRKDKLDILNKYNALAADSSLTANARKMLMLEQALMLLSGNCSEAKYKALITENLFGTELYNEYIRYRMDLLFNAGIKNLDSKKFLLDRINEIKM